MGEQRLTPPANSMPVETDAETYARLSQSWIDAEWGTPEDIAALKTLNNFIHERNLRARDVLPLRISSVEGR